jgi:acetoacetyl-CoA reductase
MAKVALVTGGTRGIGRAISARLAEDGFKVAAVYSGNESAAQSCAAEHGVFCVKANVGSYEDCKAAVDQVTAKLGPVDVLVNNAGITRDVVLHKMTPEQWSEVISVNLNSLFNMTRQVIEGMRERGWGRVINISSINGQKGQMGQTNYSAAKAGFTKALALESGKKGVTVNCIAPGYVDTEMVQAVPEKVLEGIVAQIAVGRLGRAEEIAETTAFLASDRAGFFNGATLTVNGGHFMAG